MSEEEYDVYDEEEEEEEEEEDNDTLSDEDINNLI
jgi:hypothetical protein